jgi:hypothetical protein
MIKNYLIIVLMLAGICTKAQTTLSSTSFTNNNGSGTVTFNLQNTNGYDIIITSVAGVTGSSGSLTCEVWYKTTPLSGSPGAISTANGWVLGATGSFTGVSNTSSSTTQPFLTNTNVVIPANTTYAMAIFATGQRYSTISSGTTTFSAGGVNFITGTNFGYGGGTPPATPGNSPRGWIGQLTFIPACINPSNLAANNVTINSADISWGAVPNSFGYEYLVDQNPGSPAGSGTLINTTSQSVTGLSINTTYYFHVRNKCNNAFSSWTNFPFTTADAYCKPPTNILFSSTTSSATGVLWSLMSTADHYQYYFSESPALPSYNTPGLQNTTGISTNLTGLKADTKYYFFVRSFCLGGNDSSYWKIDSFVTKALCLQPEPTTSAYSMINQTVTWNTIVSAVSYEYVMNSSIQSPAFGTEILDTSVSLTLPADNSDQYLHVRAKCNSQFSFSEWSTLALRETPQSVGNTPAADGIAVYPNPAHNMIFVKNALGKSYQLIDIRGSVLSSGSINGEDVAIPLDNIAPGMYILQVETENGKVLNRFVKQ